MNLLEMRKAAEAIILSAIQAVEPGKLVKEFVHLHDSHLSVGKLDMDVSRFSSIIVVGTGKAGASMAEAVEKILGKYICAGVVVVPEGLGRSLKHIRVLEASHPIPDERGVKGAEEIISLVKRNARMDVLILCLISGGGSALLPLPVDGLSLADKQQVTKLLLDSGATISELNSVRKHLSRIKGGLLARTAAPAKIISLILSDVIGDKLDTIASGLTAPDRSTFSDVATICRKYKVWDKLPRPAREHIENGMSGKIGDTPKPGDDSLATVENIIIGNNSRALGFAAASARSFGFQPLILTSRIEGEAREVGTVFASIAKEVECSNHPLQAPACILAGGETTVTVRGDGKGGRNQELALSAAVSISDAKNIVIAAAGTDGADGPTDAAGATVDCSSISRGVAAGLDATDFLKRNDSYNYHRGTGDLLITGRTGTNVTDLLVGLVS